VRGKEPFVWGGGLGRIGHQNPRSFFRKRDQGRTQTGGHRGQRPPWKSLRAVKEERQTGLGWGRDLLNPYGSIRKKSDGNRLSGHKGRTTKNGKKI